MCVVVLGNVPFSSCPRSSAAASSGSSSSNNAPLRPPYNNNSSSVAPRFNNTDSSFNGTNNRRFNNNNHSYAASASLNDFSPSFSHSRANGDVGLSNNSLYNSSSSSYHQQHNNNNQNSSNNNNVNSGGRNGSGASGAVKRAEPLAVPESAGPAAAKSGAGKWIPPSALIRGRETQLTLSEKNDLVFRKVRGILNKLTPENFTKLSAELLSVGLESTYVLKGVILLIFDKALDEFKYSNMYATLCRQLCERAPNFDPPPTEAGQPTSNTFRRLLLAKCHDEFENRRKASEAFERRVALSAEEQEARHIAKQKMLGNMRLIGELGKQGLLQEKILHECVQQLLRKGRSEEDLECLCHMLRTIGARLDTERGRQLVDQYFERIDKVCDASSSGAPQLPARIRFMLQDVAELRANKWIPRRAMTENGPRTMAQIRDELERDGTYSHHGGSGGSGGISGGGSGRNNNNNMGPPMRGGNGGPLYRGGSGSFGPPARSGRGIDDLFTASPPIVGGLDHREYAFRGGNRGGGGGGSGFLDGSGRVGSFGSFGGSGAGGGMYGGRSAQNLQQQQQQQRDVPPRFQKRANISQQLEELTRPSQIVLKPQKGPNAQQSLGAAQAAKANNLSSNQNSVSTFPSAVGQFPLLSNVSSALSSTASNRGTTTLGGGASSLITGGGGKGGVGAPSADAGGNSIKKMSKEEVLTRVMALLSKSDADEAIAEYKQFNVARKHLVDVWVAMMCSALKAEAEATVTDGQEKENSSSGGATVAARIVSGVLGVYFDNSSDAVPFLDALKIILGKKIGNELACCSTVAPRVLGKWCCCGDALTVGDVIRPAEVADLVQTVSRAAVDKGTESVARQFFLAYLRELHEVRGEAWLAAAVKNQKVNVMATVCGPGSNSETLSSVLEGCQLGYLAPMVRLQSLLIKQMQLAQPVGQPLTNDSDACAALERWIGENVGEKMVGDPQFSHALMWCVLRHAQAHADAAGDETVKSDLIDRFKPLLISTFAHNAARQLSALYALQVHCHARGFPKGELLSWFELLYDREVIEEEAFLRWKEDVCDDYPGKGDALFHVNAWLTWLEQAEEEEDEDEE